MACLSEVSESINVTDAPGTATMRRMLCFVLGLFFLTAHCHAEEYLKENMPFSKARKLTNEHGWQPYKTHRSGEDGFPWATIERKLLGRGIDEVSSCSMGETFCNFYYSRADECLLLETKGEQIKRMRLVYWKTVACPPAE